MSHYTVALFCLASGRWSATVGRYADAVTATEEARRHVAALCSCAVDKVIEGRAFMENNRAERCVAFVGPVSPSHHLDDLVAIVLPGSASLSRALEMRASYQFDETFASAAA